MNLLKSTATFSFFTFLSRVFGFLRDVLIAIFLGTGLLADTFFVAFRIPNTVRRLFNDGTFNAAFIPSYAREIIKGKKQSQKFANNIYSFLIIILFFLVVLMEIFMPFVISLIAPGFTGTEEKMELVVSLTRITLPYLFFMSLSTYFIAIINSYNKFALTSAIPIILNIFLIVVLLFSVYLKDELVYYLSYAVTLAGIAKFLVLYFYVKKYFLPNFTFKISMDKDIKIFFVKLLPSIFSTGVLQINIFIGTIIASFQSSAVSYLYYADRVYQLNLAISGIAVGTIILPHLSKLVYKKNYLEIKEIQNKALELCLYLSMPAAVALYLGSAPIISSLFGYGSFDEKSVSNTAMALYIFSFGLPAFAMQKIFVSFFFVRRNTKIPFYITSWAVMLNILINVIFFKKIGYLIVPIATTISIWFVVIVLYIMLIRKKFFEFNKVFFFRLPRIIFSSFAMGIIFYFLIELFSDKLVYSENFKFIYLLISVFIALCSYVLISIFTKAFKLSDIKLNYK